MVNFSGLLDEYRRDGWPYVQYDVLKGVIRASSKHPDAYCSFASRLAADMALVDASFAAHGDAEYACVNYLACLKLAKRQNKWCGHTQVLEIVAKSKIFRAVSERGVDAILPNSPRYYPAALRVQRRKRLDLTTLVVTYVAYACAQCCRRSLSAAKTVAGPDYGVLDTAMLVASLVMQLIVSRVGIFRMPKVVVVSGLGATAASTLCAGWLAPSRFRMLPFWIVNGLAQATLYPSIAVLLHASIEPEARGRVMGIWNTSTSLGGFLSATTSAIGINVRGWRGPFEAAAILAALAAFVVACTVPGHRDDHKPPASPRNVTKPPMLRNPWRMPHVPALATAYGLAKPTRYLFIFWGSYFHTSRGRTRGDVVLVNFAETCGGLFGGFCCGCLADRLFLGQFFAPVTAALSLLLLCFQNLATRSLRLDVCVVAVVASLIGALDNLASGLAASKVVQVNETAHRNAASVAATVATIAASGSIGTILQSPLVAALVQNGRWSAVFCLHAAETGLAAIILAVYTTRPTTKIKL